MAIYLTGSVTGVRDALDAHLIGYMATPNIGYQMREWIWAADNGCFGNSYVGDDAWYTWLGSHTEAQKDRCLFATAPDVVADAAATLSRSRPWLPRIRDLGYRAALVAQDGMTLDDVPWDEIDALFIGGTTEWKLGPAAALLIRETTTRGKHLHVGRVNSRRRYRRMASLGAHSVDGTHIAFSPDIHGPQVVAWVEEYSRQPALFAGGGPE